MSEITREDALAHFGVRGMKWGVRKAAQNRATKMTQRQINIHQNAIDRKGLAVRALTAPDKYTWGGNGRFEAFHNKRISQLQNSQARIDSGEMVARTLLFGPQYSKPKKS
jgi:hypothetical protein